MEQISLRIDVDSLVLGKLYMSENIETSSTLLARLTISAIEKARKDPHCWSNPSIHRALIVGGLNVLVSANQILLSDLESNLID